MPALVSLHPHKNITKFAAVVVTENYISYTVLERQGTQLWDSQKLCNWNVCEVPNDTSLPETVSISLSTV